MSELEVITVKDIDGLYYIKDVLTIEESSKIMEKLDNNNKWIPLSETKNSRLVQHYGYKYDYKSHNIYQQIEDIPEYLQYLSDLSESICNQLQIINDSYKFNQCIVNNYNKGQKISAHIDVIKYGNVICCYTLNSNGIMRFTKDCKNIDIIVEPNSLYIMSRDSRYKWKHEMLSSKSRRISITFRNVRI